MQCPYCEEEYDCTLIEEEEESDTGFTCADCLINCEGDDEA